MLVVPGRGLLPGHIHAVPWDPRLRQQYWKAKCDLNFRRLPGPGIFWLVHLQDDTGGQPELHAKSKDKTGEPSGTSSRTS